MDENVRLCIECSKRSFCSSLCPEAEIYVSQDEVGQRELSIGFPLYSCDSHIGSIGVNGERISLDIRKLNEDYGFLTLMERKILYLILSSLGRDGICFVLGLRRKTLRNKLNLIRKKILRRNSRVGTLRI